MNKNGSTPGFNINKGFNRTGFNITQKTAINRPNGHPHRDSDFDSIIARMGSLPKGREQLIYNLIVNLKMDLGITYLSDVFDIFYMFAADTQANALINWAGNYYNPTIVGSVTFVADQGFNTPTPGAGNYINTNFTPGTAVASIVNFTTNVASMGSYIRNDNGVNNNFDMGCLNGSRGGICSIERYVSNVYNMSCASQTGANYSGGGGSSTINMPTVGLFSAVHYGNSGDINNTPTYCYINGTNFQKLTSPNATTVNMALGNVFILALNLSSSAFNGSARQSAFVFMGGEIDQSILYKRIQEYLTEIGAAV